MKMKFLILISLLSYVNSQFIVGLRQRNLEKMESIVLDISNPDSRNYGHYLTTDQINQIIGYTNDEVVDLSNKLEGCECAFLGDAFSCQNGSGIYLDHPFVEFVLPLEPMRVNATTRKSVASGGYITRETIERVYSFPQNVRLVNTSGGSMEYIGSFGFSQQGLEMVQRGNNLPVHDVKHIIGDLDGTDGESQLDVQMIAITAPNGDFWYEKMDSWMYKWALDFVNREHIPYVASISWGWNERDQCEIMPGGCGNLTSQQYVARCNTEFMKIAARGVSLVVASGDAGSPGRTSENCENGMNPVFPGSSQWVTSVGATFLVQSNNKVPPKSPLCKRYSCANGTVENVCTFDETSWTSGSGFAWWTETPKWQALAVEEYLKRNISFPTVKQNGTQRWNPRGRAYPDVSAFGHNLLIFDGGWGGADGTSAAAPIFAGILMNLNDRLERANRPRIGFANPLLYKMFYENKNTFNDILVGNSSCTERKCCGQDFGFVATEGWDVVSGLGSPNLKEMLRYLEV